MELSKNARAIYKDMTEQYIICFRRIKKEEFFKAGIYAYIITGYDGVIHKAKSSGNINNHDTAYLLKVLRDYLMCIYRALEEIEV